MSISYAQNSCFVKTPPIVEILGNLYGLVTIGNIQIIDKEIIYPNDPGYNPYCRVVNGISYISYYHINDIFSSYFNDGWRMLSWSDIQTILTTLGGANATNSKKIMGYKNENWPGTNETGLNLLPHGYIYTIQSFANVFNDDFYYFGSLDASYDWYIKYDENNGLLQDRHNNYGDGYPIRLCRNVV